MARLDYNELPTEIKAAYTSKEVHKIVKPCQTSIAVHLKTHDKHIWQKSGKAWHKQALETQQEDVRDI
jgi:hypothetical protein